MSKVSHLTPFATRRLTSNVDKFFDAPKGSYFICNGFLLRKLKNSGRAMHIPACHVMPVCLGEIAEIDGARLATELVWNYGENWETIENSHLDGKLVKLS